MKQFFDEVNYTLTMASITWHLNAKKPIRNQAQIIDCKQLIQDN